MILKNESLSKEKFSRGDTVAIEEDAGISGES
jgi:hypothetical protein